MSFIQIPFVSLGLIFFLIGFFMLRSISRKKKEYTEEVEGEVVGFMEKKMASHHNNGHIHYSTGYTPVVKYRCSGKTYEYSNGVISQYPKEKIGDIMTLFVDPENPENATDLRSTKMLKLVGGVFLITGIMLFGITGLLSYLLTLVL